MPSMELQRQPAQQMQMVMMSSELVQAKQDYYELKELKEHESS